MVVILGNLLIDVFLHIEKFPVQAKSMQGLSRFDLGPGGGCNVAIMASRFGLPVTSLGEVGDDSMGHMVLEGLNKEGIDASSIKVNSDGVTGVAVVLVDSATEPGYLGYAGKPVLKHLPTGWQEPLNAAHALFVDGWIESPTQAEINLEALRKARQSGALTLFDPGPGNPRTDNGWHQVAASLSDVILLNVYEAAAMTGGRPPLEAARQLLQGESSLVVVKRGASGCLLVTNEEVVDQPGLDVEARDATGAGDSLAGAVIYGLLNDLPLSSVASLANATGAAKVMKLGTGHNLPLMAEIQPLLSTDLMLP